MRPLGWLNSVWVLAITWEVSASACTLQGRRRAPRPPPATEPQAAGHSAGSLQRRCPFTSRLTKARVPRRSSSWQVGTALACS